MLGNQEEEEGSKRCMRTGVRGDPVEGEREGGGKTTPHRGSMELSCKT